MVYQKHNKTLQLVCSKTHNFNDVMNKAINVLQSISHMYHI